MLQEADADISTEADIDDTPVAPRFDATPSSPWQEYCPTTSRTKAKQRGLGFDGEVLKETIVRKLHQANRPDLAIKLEHCHTQRFVKMCRECRKHRTFYNRCEVKYCPICAHRLARERKQSVEWWCSQIQQPKHVVLTARNSATITPQKVRDFKEAFGRLRRTKFARNWRGGFYSIEVTNEGKGWHIHLHALIEAKWIDAIELGRQWARCIGQDFAIVKVKDARQGDYLREVCKYVCKGSDLAGWIPDDLAAFCDSITANRTFGTFGTLYKLRALHRQFLDSIQADKDQCPCGCTKFAVFDENEWEWFCCTHITGPPDQILENRGATLHQIPENHPELCLKLNRPIGTLPA